MKIFIALVAMVNPVSAVPIFLGLTQENSRPERKKIAITATISIFLTLLFFTILGKGLLNILGISIGAFQIGGGLLLLLIAISMMNAQPHPTKKTSEEERSEAENKDSIAVVPLAIPLLVGPGSISTVIIYSSSAKSLWDYIQIAIASLAIAIICFIAMIFASSLAKALGRTGINIINRIMGILLAALAIEIITNGIKAIFPSLV